MITEYDLDNLDFSALTEEEQEELLSYLEVNENCPPYEGNFDAWAHEYLPKYFTLPSPKHRAEVFELLTSPGKGKRIALAEPRAHAKTTTYAMAYPLYSICEGHHKFIVIISSTAAHAKNILKSITMECENNKELVSRYPFLTPMKDSKGQFVAWNDSDIIFASGQRMMAYGVGAKLRGLNSMGGRPTLVIVDDAESKENIGTSFQRQKISDYMRQVVIPLGSPTGFDLIFSGTILHPESFLATVLGKKEFPEFYKILTKAIINWDTGETLWPENWTMKALLKVQEEIGPRAFAQEYQNTPSMIFQQVFKKENLKTFKATDIKDGKFQMGGWRRFMACDPSMGKPNGDFCSIPILALDPHGVVYVVDWVVERLVPSSLGAMLERKASEWQTEACGFETNATQGVFLDLFKANGIRVRFIEIVNNLPKKNRIDALELPVSRGQIVFRDDWENASDSYALGIRQLLAYNGQDHGDNDDGPDGLALGWQMIRNLTGQAMQSASYGR